MEKNIFRKWMDRREKANNDKKKLSWLFFKPESIESKKRENRENKDNKEKRENKDNQDNKEKRENNNDKIKSNSDINSISYENWDNFSHKNDDFELDDEFDKKDKEDKDFMKKYHIFWNEEPKQESKYHYYENIESPFKKSKKELEIFQDEVMKICIKLKEKEDNDINHKEKDWNPNFMIISGGGVKGFYLPSIFYALKEAERLNNLFGFGGTSIGGLMAGFLIMGYTPEECIEMVYSLNLSIISEHIHFTTFTQHGYFSDREWFANFISCCIYEKYGKNDITLLELYEKTKMLFCVNAVSKKEKRMVYINAFTHPHWTFIEAICATCAFPILFDEYEKDGDLFIDGGLLNNYLVELFPPERTLGIYIGKREPEIPGFITSKKKLFKYFPGIYKGLSSLYWCYAICSFHVESDIYLKTREIKKSLPREIQIVIDHNIHTISINLTEEQKMDMIFRGLSLGFYYAYVQWEKWSQK